MLNNTFLLNVALAMFGVIYFLSTLLMTGYLYIKTKITSDVLKQMIKDFFRIFFTLQAVTQRRLDPKALWVLLFFILFLAAKKYLNAF
jgi:hypothetical protein